MIFITHLLFGIVLGYIVAHATNSSDPLLFIPIASLAALIPDIDIMTSYLGRRLSFLSFVFNLAFGHRGLFHSIWVPLALYWAVAPFSLLAATALATGIVSHILIDALSPAGIRPFWPISIKISGPVKTGGFLDMATAGFLIAVVLVLIFESQPVDAVTGYVASLLN